MTTKRDFLKMMGMAPVAAPMIANTVTDAMKSEGAELTNYPTMGYGIKNYTGFGQPKEYTPGQKIQDYLDKYKSIKQDLEEILGGKEIYCDHYPNEELVISFNLDSLRSVSKSNKLLMLAKEKERRNRERRISDNKIALKELKKQLGILGYIFMGDE